MLLQLVDTHKEHTSSIKDNIVINPALSQPQLLLMSFKYTLLQSLSSIIHHTALLPLSSLLWGSFSTTRQHHTDETSV